MNQTPEPPLEPSAPGQGQTLWTARRVKPNKSGAPTTRPKPNKFGARAPVRAYTQRGGSPRQAERSPACNRRLLRRGNTRWRAAGGEQPVRNKVTGKTQSKPDSAAPTGEPASAERSPGHDPRGNGSLCLRAGSSGLWPRAETKRERTQMPWLGWRGGWGQKGWKCGRGKQGDPPGPEGRSWPQGPKSHRAGVRASVVATKRGNAREAKGGRKVEAQRP
jgi:hypothetical protein